MNEYLVELKGVYYIPDEYKEKIKGLDLKRLYYEIDENCNLKINYLSFLIDSNNERNVTKGEMFINKLRKGLLSYGKDFRETSINLHKYFIYKDKVLKNIRRENLHIEKILIRPTGRIKMKNGFLYNGKFVNYKGFSSYQKAFLTKFLTRMLTAKDIKELISYYQWAKNRVEKISNGNKDFVIKATDYIDYYFNEQKRNLNKNFFTN